MQQGVQEVRVRGGVTFLDMIAQCHDFIHMVWPATRVLVGTRVCRQLRDFFGGEEPLYLNSILQMKMSCTAADIASMKLNRFRATQINIAGIRREMSDSFRNQTSPRPFLTALLSQLSQGAPAPVSIDLMYSNIDQDASSQLLAKIVERSPRLRELNLSWNSIGVRGLEEIGKGLMRCPDFQILKLGGNELGTQGARTIAQIVSNCAALSHLDVHNNLIGPEGAASIAAALPHCPELTRLDMSDNFCGREGAASFAAVMPSCKRLQKLDLWNCRVGNEGSVFLSRALSASPSLLSLTLRGNAIGDEGGLAIAEAVATSVTLQHLDLRTNKLGNRTASALAAALQASRAPPLHASEEPRDASSEEPREPRRETGHVPGHAGAGNLTAAQGPGHEPVAEGGSGPRRLQLNLEHNRIEDEGATALARALAACQGLLQVHLSRNLIGEVGRAELVAAYPCPDTAAKALNLWEAEGLLRARRTPAAVRPPPCPRALPVSVR